MREMEICGHTQTQAACGRAVQTKKFPIEAKITGVLYAFKSRCSWSYSIGIMGISGCQLAMKANFPSSI
jgi:hypothetical protein